MAKLTEDQKKLVKGISVAYVVAVVIRLIYGLFNKNVVWKDEMLFFLGFSVVVLGLGAFMVLGSSVPRKNHKK